MKILVVCQHYWPEPYPLPDVCEELVRRGHTVHVVTDIPNYPMGVIYCEYRHGQNRTQVHNGVQITRTFTIGRGCNPLLRILNYYSYAISSTLYAKGLKEEYDVVFANQTSPIMMISAALAYAKKWKRRVIVYCMDLWPACLAAGGVTEKSMIYKYFGHLSGRLYRGSDRILITSQMFRGYLVEQHNVNNDKISYIPQYADDRFDVKPNATSKNKNTIDLVFAGNIGAAQNILTILEAANILKNEETLFWHIIGDGSEFQNIKVATIERGLQKVIIHGRVSLDKMPVYYEMADAMLVTLTSDRFISMTLPGKIQTYMAAGKPIIGSANGETAIVIKEANCGFCAKAEDAQGLADVVRNFIACKNKEQLGTNARKYYLDHFSKKKFMDKLEKELLISAESAGGEK